MNHQEIQTSPVGAIGATLSLIGLVVVIGALISVQLMTSHYQPEREYGVGDLRPLRDNLIHNGLTFLGQLILFVVGGLVGGTLSVVGIIVSAIGLQYDPKTAAQVGLCSGLAAVVILTVFTAIYL